MLSYLLLAILTVYVAAQVPPPVPIPTPGGGGRAQPVSIGSGPALVLLGDDYNWALKASVVAGACFTPAEVVTAYIKNHAIPFQSMVLTCGVNSLSCQALLYRDSSCSQLAVAPLMIARPSALISKLDVISSGFKAIQAQSDQGGPKLNYTMGVFIGL